MRCAFKYVPPNIDFKSKVLIMLFSSSTEDLEKTRSRVKKLDNEELESYIIHHFIDCCEKIKWELTKILDDH